MKILFISGQSNIRIVTVLQGSAIAFKGKYIEFEADDRQQQGKMSIPIHMLRSIEDKQ